MKVTVIGADCDYTLLQPPLTPIFRPLYRLSRKISYKATEGLINLLDSPEGNWMQYLLEGILFNCPLPFDPIPIMPPMFLSRLHKEYGIFLFSRRSNAWRDVMRSGFSSRDIDEFMSRDEVGSGVIEGGHIERCVRQLDNPETVLILSDSPMDIREGNELGAITGAMLTGYYSEEKLREACPDFVFPLYQDIESKLKVRV